MAQYLSRETLAWVKQYYIDNASSGHSVDQNKHNHMDCPAGEDTRQRLYTRVTEDNSKILLHCFNCGGSGVVPLRPSVYSLIAKANPIDTPDMRQWEEAKIEYENARHIGIKQWRNWGKDAWATKHILNEREAELMAEKDWYGIRWITQHYITPRGTTGFDYRDSEKRMYRITHPAHKNDSKVLVYNSENSDTAIVCEDAMSAMKVDLAGFGGVALCGSSLSQDDAFKLSMRFNRFLVWFDNDNDEVIANAKVAQSRLKLYSDLVGINLTDKDPKRYDMGCFAFEIESRVGKSF